MSSNLMSAPFTASPVASWSRARAALAACFERLKQQQRDYKDVAAMTDIDFRDIGVARGCVLTEIGKPFWHP